MVLRFLLCVSAVLYSISANAQSTLMDGECAIEAAAEKNELECQFRLTDPKPIRDVKVSVDGKVLEGSTFEPFDKSGKISAWLFMIDRTDPGRADDVRRHVEIVKDLASRARDNQKIGIATFGHDLRMLVDAENRNADINDRLKDVVADGLSTEFFGTSLQAIEILSKVEADRRALVIITDGKDEDTAYTAENVIEKAKEANIVIYGMGFVPRENDSPQLQRLGIMASATGGPFIKVFGNDPVPVEFKERFFDYLRNGGTVRADLEASVEEANATVEAELISGQRIERSLPIAGELPDQTQPEPVELSTIAKLYAGIAGNDSDATKWANANQGLAWIVLLVPLLVLAGLLIKLLRRPATQEGNEAATTGVPENEPDTNVQETPTTGVIPEPGVDPESYGYLELVADPGTRFWLTQDVITLGRHSASDIRLENDSVHRNHAHIQRIDGIVSIVDLDTENGVTVNGKKVAKCSLQSGDELELGEIKLRYHTS